MITVGVIALEILGYQVLVKVLPVLPNLHKQPETSGHLPAADLPGGAFVGK
jgi:Ni/Fe-hydrogenase subunit HybB-like protein